jgi:hypothetical protein
LTFVVGAAHLAHSIAGSAEILAAVLAGKVTVGTYFYWLTAAVLGHAVGGVVMVALLNYGQVVGTGRDPELAQRTLDEAEVEMTRLRHRHSAGGSDRPRAA